MASSFSLPLLKVGQAFRLPDFCQGLLGCALLFQRPSRGKTQRVQQARRGRAQFDPFEAHAGDAARPVEPELARQILRGHRPFLGEIQQAVKAGALTVTPRLHAFSFDSMTTCPRALWPSPPPIRTSRRCRRHVFIRV